MVTMARSKNLAGPYESNPANPVLTNANTAEWCKSVITPRFYVMLIRHEQFKQLVTQTSFRTLEDTGTYPSNKKTNGSSERKQVVRSPLRPLRSQSPQLAHGPRNRAHKRNLDQRLLARLPTRTRRNRSAPTTGGSQG